MLDNEAIYYGNSMFPNFIPGETLILEKVSFSELKPGDIIAVQASPRPYCHRILQMEGGEAITQGDNNDRPDRAVVTAESDFCLVVGAKSRSGEYREVSRGKQGLRLFVHNQRRRRLRKLLGRLWHRLKPLAFWRIRLKDRRRFSEMDCWYWHGLPVYRRGRKGGSRFVHSIYQLFFKI